MKVLITNISKSDILIDLGGTGNIKEKIILHSKTNTKQIITPEVFTIIKSTSGLVISQLSGSN